MKKCQKNIHSEKGQQQITVVFSTWMRKGRRETQGFMARPLSTPARGLHMKSTLSLHSFIFSYCAIAFLLPIVVHAIIRLVLNIFLISRDCTNKNELPIKIHNFVVYELVVLDFDKRLRFMWTSLYLKYISIYVLVMILLVLMDALCKC